MRKKDEVPVKAVKKALDLLSVLLFDSPQGARLKTLAQKQGLSVKTAHNLLKTMVYCGYVEKDGFGHYTGGYLCRKIAYSNQTATCPFSIVCNRYSAETCEKNQGGYDLHYSGKQCLDHFCERRPRG